jgi:TolB-like protein
MTTEVSSRHTDTSPDRDTAQLSRKNRKLRSAWISFVGRIVAQIVGAVASITLGLFLLARYGLPERAASQASPPPAAVTHSQPVKVRPTGSAPAIAVLPIQNYSKDAAHGYFADGVTETLIAELAQIAGLRVTSRTSSMTYKGSAKSVPEIARELGVDLILEGSVIRDRNVVRLTAQLIDAGADRHLWARSYDRPVRQLLPVQGELARTIARDIATAVRPTGR